MSGFAVKGWCPDAWHPMAAGDGLLVRVRPRLGRLTAAQVAGLCDAAVLYGNGLIDLTSRANLQIRGVDEAGWRRLVDRLVALDLVDDDPAMEARRAILVAPDWQAGDETVRIAQGLMARLGDLPDLPAKVGFAVDAGVAPLLTDASADFRIERGVHGGLIVRADGRATGARVTSADAPDALVALAQWFVESGGAAAGRMARHNAPLPDWADGDTPPAPAGRTLLPGTHPLGAVYGVAFGQMEARTLASLSLAAVRCTPWRVLLVEGGAVSASSVFHGDAAAVAGRVDACPGLPRCPQASVETRALALRLAPHIDGRLHVSGCAKGCACARPADVMLTGRDGLFDLAFGARANDPPLRSGLTQAAILAEFGAA